MVPPTIARMLALGLALIGCGDNVRGTSIPEGGDADLGCDLTVEWIGGPEHGTTECTTNPCAGGELACACAARLCGQPYFCLEESIGANTLRCYGDCDGCGPAGCGEGVLCRSDQCQGQGDPLRIEVSWTGDADVDLHVVRGSRDTPLCEAWDCHEGNATTLFGVAWSSAANREWVTASEAIPGDYFAYVHVKDGGALGEALDVTLRVTTYTSSTETRRPNLAEGSVWAGPRATFAYNFTNCGGPNGCVEDVAPGVLTRCADVHKWRFPWTANACL